MEGEVEVRALSQVPENVPVTFPDIAVDCASSADWNAALFTPVKQPMNAGPLESMGTTPVREMEAFVESQVYALGPMRANIDISDTEEEARKMSEDLTSFEGHAAAKGRLAKLLHAEKENAILRQHIESLKDKELDLALESGKEELLRQTEMQARYHNDMTAAAREIDYLRAECLKLGSALENRSAEDSAREQSERELLELLAIVQENVQLSKQVQKEAERAGFDIAEGRQLSTADEQLPGGDGQLSAGDEQLSAGDAQLSAGNEQLSPLIKGEQHGRGQRPRPKSAGAAPDVSWSKGTVVFTPALDRTGSDGNLRAKGEALASFGGKPLKGGHGQRGRGRLTARIRELERELEEALARPQVPVPSAPAEPSEEMHELLLVVSQVERMERHIEDLTKENERLRAAAAEPSPRSHLDIGVNSPLSDCDADVSTPLGDQMEGGNLLQSERQVGVDTFLDDEEAGVIARLGDREAGVNTLLIEQELKERVGELQRMVIDLEERVVEAETGEAQAREEVERVREELGTSERAGSDAKEELWTTKEHLQQQQLEVAQRAGEEQQVFQTAIETSVRLQKEVDDFEIKLRKQEEEAAHREGVVLEKQRALESAAESLDGFQRHVERLEAELQKQRVEKEGCIAEKEGALNAAAEACDELQKRVEELEKELRRMEEKAEERERIVAQKQKALGEAAKASSCLESRIETLETELYGALKQLAEREEMMARQQASLDSAAAASGKLHSKLGSLQMELQRALQDIADKEEALGQKREALDSLSEASRRLQQKLDVLESELGSTHSLLEESEQARRELEEGLERTGGVMMTSQLEEALQEAEGLRGQLADALVDLVGAQEREEVVVQEELERGKQAMREYERARAETEKEKERLRGQLADAEERAEVAERELERMREEVHKIGMLRGELETERDVLRRELADVQADLVRARKGEEAAEQELERVRGEVGDSGRSRKETEEQNERLRGQLVIALADVVGAQEREWTAVQEVERVRREVRELETSKQEMERELEQARGQLADALADLVGAREREQAAVREMGRLGEELRVQTAKAETERAELEEGLSAANRAAETQIENLRTEWQGKLVRAERKVGELEKDTEKWKERVAELEAESAVLAALLAGAQDAAKTLEVDSAGLRAELEAVKSENNVLKQQLADSKERLASAEEDSEAAMVKADELRRQLADAEKERSSLEGQLDVAMLDVLVYKNTVAEVKRALEQSMQSLEASKSALALEKEENSGLEMVLKTAQEKLDGSDQGAQVTELRNDVMEVIKQLQKAEAEVNRLSDELGQASNREVGLTNRLGECESALQRVESEAARWKEELGQAANRETGFIEQLDECKQALHEAEQEMALRKEELRLASDRAILLSKRVGESETALQQAEAEAAQLQEKLAQASSRATDVLKQLREALQELAETKEALFEAEAELDDSASRLRDGEEEVARASVELKAMRSDLERAREKIGGEQHRLEGKLEKARTEWQLELERLLAATEQRYSQGLETALASAKSEWEKETELLLAETQRECGWGAEEERAELERHLEEKMRRLALSVEELQAERKRLAEVAAQKEELFRRLQERTGEVGRLKEALQVERTKAGQLFERVELSGVEKERLREEVEGVSALLEVAQAQSREKEGELVEFVKQLDGAQSEYAVVVGRLQAVELEVLEWQAAAEGIQEELIKEREEKGQLAEQMAVLISKAQELEAGGKVESERAVLQQQLDDALKLGEEALSGTEEKERQLGEVRKQVSETEKQVKELRAQLRDAVAACDAAKEETDLSDSRAVQMEREMGELREQRQQARAALQAACMDGEEAEKRGEAARRELEGVRKELTRVRNELTSVRTELVGVRNKLAGSEKEAECVRSERCGLRKQLEGVQRDLGIAEKELKDELEGVRQEGEDLRRRLEAAETGLEEAQRVVQAKEEDLIRREEMAAEKERELEGQVVTLETALKTAQAELELLERSRGSMAEDLANAEERLGEKKKNMVSLEKEVEETRGLAGRLEKELLGKREEGERLEKCVAELEAALTSARGQLTAAGRKSEELENLVGNLQDELSKAREVQGLKPAADQQAGHLDGRHVAGEEGGHVAAAELAAVEKELAATRRAWGAGKEIIEELRAQLAACQDETKELEDELESLRRQLAANVIKMEAEVTARVEKGFGVWAVLLVAGWCAMWKTEEEKLGEEGFSDAVRADPQVRKRLTFDGEAALHQPARAQGQSAIEETDQTKGGCGKETQGEETGVRLGSDLASDTRSGRSDLPGCEVAAAQQMLSELRRQSERLHSQLAGLALTELDGGRQRDVSEDAERVAGGEERSEGELQAQLQGLLSRLREIQASLVHFSGPSPDEEENAGESDSFSNPLEEGPPSSSPEASFAQVLAVLRENTRLWAQIWTLPSIPSALGQSHAASLGDIEGLIARHGTLQRQLQRHAREQDRQNGSSGENSARNPCLSGETAREDITSNVLVREESFGKRQSEAEESGTRDGVESSGSQKKGKNEGRLVSLHGMGGKETAADRRTPESKAGTGSVEGEGAERRGEGGLMGALESRAPAIDELSELLQDSEEQRSLQTARLAQLEGELATCQQQREKLEAQLAQTLSAEKPKCGRLEEGTENAGERDFETARTWGLETATARGARAWFNPIFAEDGLALTEEDEAGMGSEGSEDMATRTGILAVVGDRDKLLRQNGRLVMELESLKSQLAAAQDGLWKAQADLNMAATCASELDLAYGQLVKELEQIRTEKEGLVLQNEEIRTEKESLFLENEEIRTEKEGLVLQTERIRTEKEGLVLENEKIRTEKEGLVLENEQIRAENEGLVQDKLKLEQNLGEKNDSFQKQLKVEDARLQKAGLVQDKQNVEQSRTSGKLVPAGGSHIRTPDRVLRTRVLRVRTPDKPIRTPTKEREESRKREIEEGVGREDKRRRQEDEGKPADVEKAIADLQSVEISAEERRAAALIGAEAAGVNEVEERWHLRGILERVLEENRRLQASLSEQCASVDRLSRQSRHEARRAKRVEAECRTLTGRLHEQGLRLETVLKEHADVAHRLGRKELAVAALQRHIKVLTKENREVHEALRGRESRIDELENNGARRK